MRITHQALTFATQAHDGQYRKNGTTPYITHPIGVALSAARYGGDDNQIMIALLHDTIEDCGVTGLDLIEHGFDPDVVDGVLALTNTSKAQSPELNRAQRKAIDNLRLADIPTRYKFVKLCDIMYNVEDLDGLERGFAKKFLGEKRVQAETVRAGSEILYRQIVDIIDHRLANFGE